MLNNEIKKLILKRLNMSYEYPLTAFFNNEEFKKLTKGELSFQLTDEYDNPKNIFLCFEVNQPFLETVNELRKKELIKIEPTDPFVVMFDGGYVPKMPIAKKISHSYSSPRWLPTLVRRGKKFKPQKLKFEDL